MEEGTMGIDVTLCVREEERWVPEGEGERVADVDEFFVMAYTFGLVLGNVRTIMASVEAGPEMPDMKAALANFEEYLDEDREASIERFQGYYNFIARTNETLKAELGEGEFVWGDVIAQLEPTDFIADAKAFFGRFMLSDRMIEPEEAAIAVPVLGLMMELLKHYAGQPEYKEYAGNLNLTRECLDVISDFCYAAIQEGRAMYFAA
jgi:hypothetical protein